MDKRYQVFVSSTFADLQEERQAVMQALLSLDHFPAGMELFPASDDDQFALISGVIDDSDYYVLVIGGRYGSTSDSGVSYTEMEFDYAVKKKIPVLAFIHEKPEDIVAKKTDQNDNLRQQLEEFKKKIKTHRHVKFYKSADNLKAQVIQSIAAETKRNPREGWIRANRAVDPTLLESMRQEIDRLKNDLQFSDSAAPKDADAYAGGSDDFVANFSYSRAGEYSTKYGKVSVDWDRIFFEVGPLLMEESSERQMRVRLSNELYLYEDTEKYKGAQRVKISDDSFETIKIQLMALGLIRKSGKKHVPSDTDNYWSLTSYGENYLMKLRAITKEPTPAKKGAAKDAPADEPEITFDGDEIPF